MLIAQITDLHVVGNGQLCQGRVATNAQLQGAVAHINNLDPRQDVVLATGDLTDHGTVKEYAVLRDILAALLPPLYLIPGNHDHRDVLLEAFADHAYLPRLGAPFAHYVIEEYPVRLMGLDTTCLAILTSAGTCIPKGVSTFFHAAFTAHSDVGADAGGNQVQHQTVSKPHFLSVLVLQTLDLVKPHF